MPNRGVNKKANPITVELAFRDLHSPIAAAPNSVTYHCRFLFPVNLFEYNNTVWRLYDSLFYIILLTFYLSSICARILH
jgi:hypothetical protein